MCARFDNEYGTWKDWLKYKQGEEPDEERIFRCAECGYEAPEDHFRRPFMERLMCKQCESVSIERIKEKNDEN